MQLYKAASIRSYWTDEETDLETWDDLLQAMEVVKGSSKIQ